MLGFSGSLLKMTFANTLAFTPLSLRLGTSLVRAYFGAKKSKIFRSRLTTHRGTLSPSWI